MTFDEGIAKRNGSTLNIQCLLMVCTKHQTLAHEHEYHFHEYVELIYMLEGEMTGYVLMNKTPLKTGDLYIIYPNEAHDFRRFTDCRYIVIKFLPDIIYSREGSANEFEYLINLNSDHEKRTRIIKNRRDIGELICKAWEDFEENRYTSELLVRSAILRVCAEILEYWKEQNQLITIDSAIKHENIEAIKKIMDTVKESREVIKTHQAAQMCNMSDGHFSRIFKSVTGITFGRYVKLSRLTYAQQLLRSTDASITEIAQELNYATTSHFIEDFRKEKGISPKQYRKFVQK